MTMMIRWKEESENWGCCRRRGSSSSGAINLSLTPISKRPIVCDTYGNPQGVTTGTFRLVLLSNYAPTPRYSPLNSHKLPFPLIIFLNHTRPIGIMSHIADHTIIPLQIIILPKQHYGTTHPTYTNNLLLHLQRRSRGQTQTR